MGWKGTLRSVVATARAIERDAERRRKERFRAQIASDATAAVVDWEEYVQELISIHTSLTDIIDWHAIAASPPPVKPILRSSHQDKANAAREAFRPGLLNILYGGTDRRRRRLENNIVRAPERDRVDHKAALAKYTKEECDWKSEAGLAQRLVGGEAKAIKEVIEEMQSLSSTNLIGSSVSFSISDGLVHAKPEVHSDEIIPDFRRKQLASGRLSETNMPVGQFNELYQDYVASVSLKISGDLFRILPLDEIYVTCLSLMLNSQTGHQELSPILSVQFVRNTYMNLDLNHVDPSDSMRNFNHAMSFRKSKGFRPVEALMPID